MAKLRLIPENYADAATFFAIPALATDIDNLKEPSRAKIARTDVSDYSDMYDQDISLFFPAAKTISGIVLGRHNFVVGTNIKIVLYSDYFTTILYDTGDLVVTDTEAAPTGLELWDTNQLLASNYVHWTHIPDTGSPLVETTTGDPLLETTTGDPLLESGTIIFGINKVENVQSIKIYFSVPNGSQVDIGRLIVGEYVEPKYNLNYNHKIEWSEESDQYRTEGLTLRSDINLPNRKIEFSLDTINENDRVKLVDSFRYFGLRKDFYISLFPDSVSPEKERDYSGIMKITKEPRVSEYAPNLYSSKYIMEEV